MIAVQVWYIVSWVLQIMAALLLIGFAAFGIALAGYQLKRKWELK